MVIFLNIYIPRFAFLSSDMLRDNLTSKLQILHLFFAGLWIIFACVVVSFLITFDRTTTNANLNLSYVLLAYFVSIGLTSIVASLLMQVIHLFALIECNVIESFVCTVYRVMVGIHVVFRRREIFTQNSPSKQIFLHHNGSENIFSVFILYTYIRIINISQFFVIFI